MASIALPCSPSLQNECGVAVGLNEYGIPIQERWLVVHIVHLVLYKI
jgi:hypothetical protein